MSVVGCIGVVASWTVVLADLLNEVGLAQEGEGSVHSAQADVGDLLAHYAVDPVGIGMFVACPNGLQYGLALTGHAYGFRSDLSALPYNTCDTLLTSIAALPIPGVSRSPSSVRLGGDATL